MFSRLAEKRKRATVGIRVEGLGSRIMLLGGWRRALLAFLAGAFGVLALPPFNIFAALFVSFPILVWLLDGIGGSVFARLRAAFGLGWLFGWGYFVAGLWWLGHALMVDADEFAWAVPLAVLGLPAYLALYYGLAAMVARLLWSDGLGRIAALAFGFGLGEWLRGFIATGFPWNAIGYGAMPVPLMMQSAHLIGVAGVTVLAVFVFSMPALLATRRGLAAGAALAALLLAAHLGYGAYALNRAETPREREVTLRIVQPRIDQAQKLDDGEREAVFAEHLALTAKPPGEGEKRPDIVVWPETSVPYLLTQNHEALTRIADVLEPGQVLLAGAVRVEDSGPGADPRYYNSIYVIDDQGQIVGAADKVHLVPFGEYLPFEDLWRSLGVDQAIADMPGGFSAAVSRAGLTLPDGLRFYPLICYEAIFPDEMTGDLSGFDALLNVTNDAWFGYTPGPYQHFQQARLRAVEQGVPLVRAANNGISALVDAKGRIVAGLDFEARGSIQFTLGGRLSPLMDNVGRMRVFWLLMAVMIALAGFSRAHFIFSRH